MQIPDTDTPLILLALGVAMYHVPDPESVEMEELERRIQVLRGTDFEQINEDNTMSNEFPPDLFHMVHAAVTLAKNERIERASKLRERLLTLYPGKEELINEALATWGEHNKRNSS